MLLTSGLHTRSAARVIRLFFLIQTFLAWSVFAELPRETTGAAPGYVADSECRVCHTEKWDTYQAVGMSQSMKRPLNARPMERFGETFFHEASQRYYEINKREDELSFRRYQRDAAGEVVNELTLPVDWVLGSGNRTRNYLYQNAHGELFQLPLGWYAEGDFWEMSPGFEDASHDGVSRKITRECLFCHNAYPETRQDSYADSALFPAGMPEGTGCQRCHGPGGDHIRAALTGSALDDIRHAITNPARLIGDTRDSVCMQCHLLPAFSLAGPRRFGRGVYSFRPGELLSDYIVHLDIRESGVPEPARFEINHHGYRLMKSDCYNESGGALTCTSCHDPHVKPPSNEFREATGEVCLGCHASVTHTEPVTTADCVTCHMPTRRTTDVIHVTMTDHWISRGPFDPEALIAPVTPGIKPISQVSILPFGDPPTGLDEETYIAIGAMRAGRSIEDATRALIRSLSKKEFDDYAPYLDLARARLQQGQFRQAEAAARGLAAGAPDLPAAYSLMGIAQMAQGAYREALISFRRSIDLQPDPEVHFNLAAAYLNTGQTTLAENQLDRALGLRPTMSAAYRLLGQIHWQRGAGDKAKAALLDALRMDPGDTNSYALLIELFSSLGEPEEAKRYLELGTRAARQPGRLKSLDPG